jgi:hypothetical protein
MLVSAGSCRGGEALTPKPVTNTLNDLSLGIITLNVWYRNGGVLWSFCTQH